MAPPRPASVDERLETSLQIVATHANQMRKSLESPQGKLLVAVKQVTSMLGELMTADLPPRLYYELYNSCFDTLSQLQEYLVEDHRNHHLADVYEIVEYVGNVLPRLYLMITVGAAFLASGDAPKTEVLKDMLEMARGVQNPLRGLFLRYYLGQRTGEFLVGSHDDVQFSVQFTLTNFVEMNKLWVRYQYQGHSRDYNQRLSERTQLQTIVGSSILRLSQLDAVDLSMFSNKILPAVLDQAVQCRDELAQEYLLDVIVQVFPTEFHLETLALFLDCLEFLHPDTSVSAILITSMNRVMNFADAKFAEIDANAELADAETEKSDTKATGVNTVAEPELSTKKAEKNPPESSDDLATKTENLKVSCETQDSKGVHLDQEELSTEPHTEKDSSETTVPTDDEFNLEEVDRAPESTTEAAEAPIIREKAQDSKNTESNYEDDSEAVEGDASDQVEINEHKALQNYMNDIITLYWTKIYSLKLALTQRASLAHALIELSSITETTLSLKELFSYVMADKIEQSEEVEQLLLALFETNQEFPIIMDVLKDHPQLLSSQSSSIRHSVAEKLIDMLLVTENEVTDVDQTHQVLELFAALLRSGDFDTSKVSQFIRRIKADSVASSLEILQLAHKTMREGGQQVVRKTSNVIVNAAIGLISHAADVVSQFNASDVSRVLKFVNKVICDLATVGDSPYAAFRLYVSSAMAADYCGSEEAAYELFAQALTTYEESSMDSHQQIVALSIVIQNLQRSSVFTSESFEPLAQRCTQYAQRLLKKPDQCSTLLQAAHLYWDNDYSDARRVEEVLGRALRSADSVMDSIVSIELFLDVLDSNLYFLANDTSTVTVSSVNSLLRLINENIMNAKKDGYDLKTMQPSLNELEARLVRTQAYVRDLMSTFPRFEGLEFLRTSSAEEP